MRSTSLFLALALTLASCGGAADPASLNSNGYDALGSRDHAAAATEFQAALDALAGDTANTEYQRAMMGLIEANVHLDAPSAQADFIALAESGSVSARDYAYVGGLLADAKKYPQAIAVLDHGVKANPETPDLIAILKRIEADASKSGDADTLKALEGLGYL